MNTKPFRIFMSLLLATGALLTPMLGALAAGPYDWIDVSPTTSPAVRSLHALAYDSTRQQVVLFGGGGNNGYLNDTWLWDGATWTQANPASKPMGRTASAMVFDAARGQVVLFGGFDGANDLNDTWVWDGATWTKQTPTTSPPARVFHAMAYDATRQKVVLFGGADSSNGDLGDTWVWDGRNWTDVTPAPSPAVRTEPQMAYDAARGEVVLFGGRDSTGRLNDTWTWNGAKWTQKNPTQSPPPARNGPGMAFDAGAGAVVLFGGEGGTSWLTDTWTWDGANWTQASPAHSPTPPRMLFGDVVYDAARGQVVLFGGNIPSAAANDTWVYTPTGSTQATVSVTAPEGGLGVAPRNIVFPAVSLTGQDVTVNATDLAWQADDSSGVGAGWHVTLDAGDFSDGSTNIIPVAGFKVQMANTAISPVTGNSATPPTSQVITATVLDATGVSVLSAASGAGQGAFNFTPSFSLLVPAGTTPGNYSTTVTVTAAAGP